MDARTAHQQCIRCLRSPLGATGGLESDQHDYCCTPAHGEPHAQQAILTSRGSGVSHAPREAGVRLLPKDGSGANASLCLRCTGTPTAELMDELTRQRVSFGLVHWGVAALYAEGDASTHLGLGPWRVQPSGLARPLTHGLVLGWTGVACHWLTSSDPGATSHGNLLDFDCLGCSGRAGRQDPAAVADSRHAAAQARCRSSPASLWQR